VTPDPEPAAGVPGLAAIVLAGGRGSRLGGTDKPGLVVGASTLLAAVISAAIEAGASHIVVVGPARPGTGRRPGGGCRIDLISEDPPGSGPVAGLRCGIAGVRAPGVLAADMPFLRAPHLLALLARPASSQRPRPGGPDVPRPRRMAPGSLSWARS
jgi:molybdenum cofactor guanylyltransferase